MPTAIFPCVIVDVETTGLDPHQGSIIEIGAVRLEADGSLHEFQVLIRPRVPIEPQAFRAHGISEEEANTKGSDPGAAFKRFQEFVGDAILVAHNGIGFDYPFLAVEMDRYGVSRQANPLLDTVPIAKRFVKTNDGGFSLRSLCETYQVSNERAHRALEDARATAKVFQAMLKCASDAEVLWQTSYALQFGTILEVPAGYELLEVAIRDGRELYVEYQSSGQAPRERWVRPRNLTVGNSGARCLKAICLEENIEKTFRLDRMRRLIQLR